MIKRTNFLKFVCAVALLLFCHGVLAQRTITGVVFDANTTETLPGAHVVVKGTTIGAVVDIEGRYRIVVPQGRNELEFSLIGYITQTVAIGTSDVINVRMYTSATELDEVVVTGFGGTQLRSELTTSIATVREEMLTIGSFNNPAQALSGAVSGLRVVQSTGRPGAVPSIVLRGGTEFDGSGSPLVLVDGKVLTISDINPNDIASIEVLKCAAATAIYGARANNGVILITTKRGAPGRAEVNIRYRNDFNFLVPIYDFMNAADYLHWARTGVQTAGTYFRTNAGALSGHGAGNLASLNGAFPFGLGNRYFDAHNNPLDGNATTLAIWSPMVLTENLRFLLDQGWKTMIDPITGQEIIFSEFDRSSTAFNNPAISRDLNISLSGGNDRGTYYAGLGFQHEDGLPISTWYQRLNFIFNSDYKIREWFSSSSSFSFNNARWDNQRVVEGNYFGRMLSAPPTQRERNANGELLLGPNWDDGNPLYNDGRFIRNNMTRRFTMSQAFQADIAQGLNFRVTGNWLYTLGHIEVFNRDHMRIPGVWNRERWSTSQFNNTLSQTYNAILNYNTTIAGHSVSVLLGSEFYDNYNQGLFGSGIGAPTDDFRDLAYTTTEAGRRIVDSWNVRERILSFFGRVNYDFMDRYLLSLTFRQDGYSRLLGENQWGFFPGVSAGWIISRENFMAGLTDVLSFVKLRTSFGLNGNVAGVGPYELQGSFINNLYDGRVGFLVGAIPNPGLRWERSNTFEIGADIGFLENRIITNITYYNRLTRDKFASIPLPISSGISSIRSNNGKFRNEGFELDLVYRVLRRGGFSWDINANVSHNISTVVQLPNNGLLNNRQGGFQVWDPITGELVWVGGLQEGQRPGGLWVFVAEGIFRDWDHVNTIAANRIDRTTGNHGSNSRPLFGPQLWNNMTDAQRGNGLPIQPGDVIWKDLNGDNIIDDRDMQYVGNINPDFIGGFATNLSYRGLRLSIQTDFAIGFYQLDNIRPWFMGMMQGTFNTLEETKNTWTPENTNAPYPIFMWADQLGKRNYARPSSLFVYESSFLALRAVSLSYTLPRGLISALDNATIEFSVTGMNLGYLTASKLYTPEVSGTGGVEAGYSLPRSLIFGVNVRF